MVKGINHSSCSSKVNSGSKSMYIMNGLFDILNVCNWFMFCINMIQCWVGAYYLAISWKCNKLALVEQHTLGSFLMSKRT